MDVKCRQTQTRGLSVHSQCIIHSVFFLKLSQSIKVVYKISVSIITCISKNVTLTFSKIKVSFYPFDLNIPFLYPLKTSQKRVYTRTTGLKQIEFMPEKFST